MPRYRVHFKSGASVGPIEASSPEAAKRIAIRDQWDTAIGGNTGEVDRVTREGGGSSRKGQRGFPKGAKCESGWTGDRCTKPLGHSGPHSNE